MGAPPNVAAQQAIGRFCGGGGRVQSCRYDHDQNQQDLARPNPRLCVALSDAADRQRRSLPLAYSIAACAAESAADNHHTACDRTNPVKRQIGDPITVAGRPMGFPSAMAECGGCSRHPVKRSTSVRAGCGPLSGCVLSTLPHGYRVSSTTVVLPQKINDSTLAITAGPAALPSCGDSQSDRRSSSHDSSTELE